MPRPTSRSRRSRKQSRPELIIAGVAGVGLLLFGASVWFATSTPPQVPDETPTVDVDDLPPPDTKTPTETPPRTPERPVSDPPDTADSTPVDPYAEMQKELQEPLPIEELAPRTTPDPSVDLKDEGDGPSSGGQTVRIKRVVDGDTVHLVDGRKVRLIGINTPERGKPLYREAKQCLTDLVGSGALKLKLGTEPKDRYGRTLAYLYAGDTFLNAEMVKRGFAYCYTWRPNDEHEDTLRALQREARGAKRGLWGLDPPRPEKVYVGSKSGHYFHRPSCRRVRRIRDRNRVEWKQRTVALDEGMNPCDDCDS